MTAYLRREIPVGAPLGQALAASLRTWALGDRAQRQAREEHDRTDEKRRGADAPGPVDADTLSAYLRETLPEKTIECAVLDRAQPGSSKYRALTPDEMGRLLPSEFNPALGI